MSTWDISLGDLSLMDATYCVTVLDTTTPGRVRLTLYIDGPDEKALIDAFRVLEQRVNEATRRSMPTSVSSWLMLSVKPEGSETVRYAVRRGTVTVPRTQVGGIQMSEGWIDGVLLDLECLPYTLGEPIEYGPETVTGRQPWVVVDGIPGDEPALVELRIADQSEGHVINRVLVGSRSGDENYVPVLPFVEGEDVGPDDDTFSGWLAEGDADVIWANIGEQIRDAGPSGIYDWVARLRDGTEYLGRPGVANLSWTPGLALRQSRPGTSSATLINESLPGSLLVVVAVSSSGAISTPSGFTLVDSVNHSSGNGPRVYLFYRENAPATSTVTASGASRMVVKEFLGIKTSSSLDESATGHTSADYLSVGPTGTLAQARSLVIGGFGVGGGSWPTGVPGYGWSLTQGALQSVTKTGDPNGSWLAALGHRVIASTSGVTVSQNFVHDHFSQSVRQAGVVAVFAAAESSDPTVAAGSYQFCIMAINSGGEWGPVSDVSEITTIGIGAINLEWSPSSGPVDHYRVYWREGANAWSYFETGDDTPAYIMTTTSGATTADPPERSSIEQSDFRMQLALESGTTIDLTTPPITSVVANAEWEPALMHRGPVPVGPEAFGPGEAGWMSRMQSISGVSRPVAVDALMLMPADEQQIDVQYLLGNLATPREWVIGTTPAMRTYAWLRDLDTGHEAGRLHALGYCLMGPGDTTVVLLMTTAGGVWQIEDVEAEVSMTIIPRYRWLAGGV